MAEWKIRGKTNPKCLSMFSSRWDQWITGVIVTLNWGILASNCLANVYPITYKVLCMLGGAGFQQQNHHPIFTIHSKILSFNPALKIMLGISLTSNPASMTVSMRHAACQTARCFVFNWWPIVAATWVWHCWTSHVLVTRFNQHADHSHIEWNAPS